MSPPAQDPSDPTAGLVVVNARPPNAESPAAALAHAVTPAAAVYVRTNFGVPAPEAVGDHLTVGGAVRAPLGLAWDELRAMPQHAVTVTMECAGNDRLAVRPLPEGEPWRTGAVSTAEWTGVRLADLLRLAGLRDDAVEVLGTGADAGLRADAGTPDLVRFARSLPVAEARAGDALVALALNGAPLPPAHGAPARLVVPGWYGMASVKWLTRLDALTSPYDGYFQRRRYVYDAADGSPVRPVTRQRVKSMIVAPADGARAPRGAVAVWGWAWSGAAPVVEVAVAAAGGGAWHPARVDPGASPYAWVRWETVVRLDAAGRVALRSRARDASGAVQPEVPPWNRLGYGNNAVRAVVVDVV